MEHEIPFNCKSCITLLFLLVRLYCRQRLSAPINLVMEQEWRKKFRPQMEDAAEEDGDEESDEEGEYQIEETNRHNYSL